jgi:hypothetical protein
MVKTDCAMYDKNKCLCRGLDVLECQNCKFYKTVDRLKKERKASRDRLNGLGARV